MKKKSIIIISVFVVVGIVAYWVLTNRKEKETVWKVVPIETGNTRLVVTATGSINALTTVQVGTQVSGTIDKLLADFNTTVKKGQVIALLDTTFLSAARDEAEAMLAKATIHLHEMQTEWERIKHLYDGGAVAKAEYDLSHTNFQSAQVDIKSAEAALNRARINLRYATIRAPISGVVISRNVDVGQTVVASFNSPVLFTIANDLTQMQVYANVDEADIGQVKVGQEAVFTVDAYPRDFFTGIIKQIRMQANVIQNVVNYTVIIDVANPELKLLPGLTANINIKVKEHLNVLKVPTKALRYVPPAAYLETLKEQETYKYYLNNKYSATDTLTYLWIKKGALVLPRPVSIGLMEGGFAEVRGDIAQADSVVIGLQKENNGTNVQNPFLPSMKSSKKN